jgi:hypothetical protein
MTFKSERSRMRSSGSERARDRDKMGHSIWATCGLRDRRGRGVDERLRRGPVGLMVNSRQLVTVTRDSCVGQPVKGSSAESSEMSNPITTRTPGTTRRSTTATMIRRRTHRGPPPVCLDHERWSSTSAPPPAGAPPGPLLPALWPWLPGIFRESKQRGHDHKEAEEGDGWPVPSFRPKGSSRCSS